MISELEVANTRLKMICEHAKEINEKNPATKTKNVCSNEPITPVDAREASTKDSNKVPFKCFYENNGNCRESEIKCKFVHPKKTCQAYSKLGSCPQESLCEHRNPQKICFRLQSTGYCPTGDRCRSRQPLEYAY